MKFYRLHTKDAQVGIRAKSRKEAFAKFFKDVVDGKIQLSELGNIVILHDGKTEYPFRTVPSLFILGLMNETAAISNIASCISSDRVEASKMLYKAIEKDKWIYKAVMGKQPKIWPPTP